ncbi:MAG: PAS domain S-box protein [Campylobacterales bacterium]|nr:PAS domain S-box protein [Campylobacterales bacterium]
MFCETMGYKYSELIGKSHNIVKSPYSEKETFQKLWETIGQDNVFRGVIQNRTKDARVIWFEILIKPD